MDAPHVESVNAGRVKPVAWGSLKRSAIDKRPVDGSVRVGRLGLAVDEQADRVDHGGVDKAVYAYAREDLAWWAERLGRDLRAGQFGENLTLRGVDVNGAVVGERWRVGSVDLEVCAPRIPCSTFQGFLGEQQWVKRFTAAGRPGAYCRVRTEGSLAAGDPVDVVHRPEHGVTVAYAFRALTTDRDLLPRLLDAPELPAEAHDAARRFLAGTAQPR